MQNDVIDQFFSYLKKKFKSKMNIECEKNSTQHIEQNQKGNRLHQKKRIQKNSYDSVKKQLTAIHHIERYLKLLQ